MTASSEMMDFDGPLAGAPNAAAGTTGTSTDNTDKDSKSKSRWSSTSSTETELDNFWHDSTLSNHFYTTQDTSCTLESFDFNNDNLFFGPFDSCSTGPSQYNSQNISHVVDTPTAGIESIDFAGASQSNPDLLGGFDPLIADLETNSIAADGDALDLSWSTLDFDKDSTSLKDKLSNALIRGDGGRLFLPDDAFQTLLPPETVFSELKKHFPVMSAQELQRLAARITARDFQGWLPFSGLLRTFAILVMLDQVDKIIDFIQEGVTDMALPVAAVKSSNGGVTSSTIDLRRRDNPDLLLRCFNGWSQADLENFEKLQWRFLSPIFSDAARKQDLVDLEEKAVLPYIESWENKKQNHYKGGNSEVWKVKIHNAHHNFQNLPTAIPNDPYFAIKRLKSKDEEAFHREVRNLQRLHNAEHPNLLSLLATYKYRGYYHLVFPWADGDLRRLWQSTENPQPGKDEMRWLADQCASIASALKSVHAGAESWLNSTNDPAGQQRLMNKIGIHGDIKPENIFIFSRGQQNKSKELAMGPPTTKSTPSERSSRSGSPSSVTDDRVLVMGDFGGGAFYDATTNPDPLRQITVAYRPPEYDTKLRPVSRSWDVWGLGCTYLEFITWFLLGPSGLKEFAKRRTTKTAAGKMSDEYFETFIDPSQTGGIGAILKGSVLAWINDLARHQNASPYIRDFLDFITHRMFIIENANRTRASGEEVAEHMNMLSRQCLGNDVYCLPIPTIQSPWDSKAIDNGVTTAPSMTPDDFSFNFNTESQDVAALSTAAWNYPSLDLSPLGQWNTAPIMPGGLAFHNSLSCSDMLGTWNYTAPVAWNNVDDSMSPESIDSRKRKRKVDESKEIERRVSPKTSTSPQASGSSTVDESPTDTSGKSTAEKRFACPYYKNNPGKFRQKRTCCGPGWPTVHRVKEHLYRCHTIGKHTCSRCLTKCKSAAELLAHQRAAVPCATRTDAFPEGTMLPSQEEALRIKKRVPPNTTEEQRWNEVYMVLFPEEQVDALPTPFYEDEPPDPRHSAEGSSKQDPANDTWLCSTSEYERYLSQSLPPRVQRELEREVQREFGFVGDVTQTRKVVDMVQKLQLRLFRQYERDSRASRQGMDGSQGGSQV